MIRIKTNPFFSIGNLSEVVFGLNFEETEKSSTESQVFGKLRKEHEVEKLTAAWSAEKVGDVRVVSSILGLKMLFDA